MVMNKLFIFLVGGKMKVYHCTTPKKLKRYKASGGILPPVRFWSSEYSALKWMRKTGRNILLCFEAPQRTYPLPIKGGAFWSDQIIYNKEIQQINCSEIIKVFDLPEDNS
jgi:hypothetical protein